MPNFIIARTITIAVRAAREKGWRLKDAATGVWETPKGEEVKYMSDVRNGWRWNDVEQSGVIYCADGWERRQDHVRSRD